MTPKLVAGVIGLGRFGGALVRSLRDIGVDVRPLDRITQDKETAYRNWLADCHVICVAVRDDQIAGIARELAVDDLTGKTVLMHSGTANLDLLDPLARCGAATGKFHPLQAFTATSDAPIPTGTPFAIEGPVRDLVEPWVTAWEGSLHELAGDQWLVYHIAAVMAANFLPLFVRAGSSLLEPMSKGQAEALTWLEPLVRCTIDAALDPENSRPFSGPAIRGDQKTLDNHMNWLAEHRPELLPIYRLATESVRKYRDTHAQKSPADVK